MAETLSMDKLQLGTRVVNVFYCQVCSIPPEYCAFGSSFSKCQVWLKENNEDLYQQLYGQGEAPTESKDKPESQQKKKVMPS
jgi:hypothetical protein